MKGKFIQRKDAKMPSRKEICFSLTPGFSQAPDAIEMEKPFQRFLRARCKPLKRFAWISGKFTRLRPGVNEIWCLRAFAPLR
jgi:hypothetical protein